MDVKKYHHGDLKNALIQAGIEVLTHEGLAGLSLRKVAKQAGVSHAAPYAHFTDKQAIIAAISTEGYRKLYQCLSDAIDKAKGNPHKQLIETAWAYIQFARQESGCFKIMFSGVLEQEKDYPEFVEVSQRTFALVVDIVKACQKAKILREETPQLLGVVIWGQVHGVISLIFLGQIPHMVLDRYPMREMLIRTMNQLTLVNYSE
ncbi:MAG: TetR/AcrR family transcriptional regulator [Anaerolineaceae bacterium]|nr:TetR/AcrR family transcriptional regulator [Anaerolineaceae bacterium]